jgi:hypothetical protein
MTHSKLQLSSGNHEGQTNTQTVNKLKPIYPPEGQLSIYFWSTTMCKIVALKKNHTDNVFNDAK